VRRIRPDGKANYPTKPDQLINSPQLEASLEAAVNPTQDFGIRIRGIRDDDSPAVENTEESRAAFEEAGKRRARGS
jgi:hypothetical protein